MQIVLPGALPDPREARELTSYLQTSAPTLLRWLERGRARSVSADPAISACTPYEHWQLDANRFTPTSGQPLSAGLGPLRYSGEISPDQPIWLAELVHIAPSRDGAVLLPGHTLNITPEQSVALFESASSLFQDSDFTLHPADTGHWRIELPADWQPSCASPALVSITSVNDWWRQDMAGRPWRKLGNELQMHWFQDPVNQARAELGQMPINGLWLFGGASTSQLGDKNRIAGTQVYDDLLSWHTTRDWGGWLAALADLETRVFLPLADTHPTLILTGVDRYVTITPNPWARWTHRLPGLRTTWRTWWSPQN